MSKDNNKKVKSDKQTIKESKEERKLSEFDKTMLTILKAGKPKK